MPTIDPTRVPTVNPGYLFSQLTSNTTYSIRWLTIVDPAYFEVLNRPIADVALRQLIIAKTLDSVNLALGHQALFPFLVSPRVVGGSGEADLPASWIYDLHVSLPAKWENVRLAKIKRVAGTNGETTDYTGKLRLVFTASQVNTTTQTAVFQADYTIDSVLGYQVSRVSVPTSSEEAIVVQQSERETINGFVVFRTLSLSESETTDFLDAVAPPLVQTDSNSDGEFDDPAEYDIADSAAGGADVTNDYTLAGLASGTGLLLPSATNAIPAADSDTSTWLTTFNYPFDSEDGLQSTSPVGITIPTALFKEFNIVAPSSDKPTGDSTGENYPVYISRIVREDAGADTLTFYFATFNVESASIVPVEFATLTLNRTDTVGTILPIVPIENLWPTHAGDTSWNQGFGTGFVMLSSEWTDSGSTITDFFDSFIAVSGDPAAAVFASSDTRIGAFGVSRVPKSVPTAGQADALLGSLADTQAPSSSNRYVVEGDQGLGTTVDFTTETSIPANKRTHVAIERYGYTGALVHRVIQLVIDAQNTTIDYDTDILPRLTILLDRAPAFGDFWWDGTRLKFFNGSTWVG